MALPDDWFREIGRFVVAFEGVCDDARIFILSMIPMHDTATHQIQVTVLQHLEAQQVIDTVRAILERTGHLGDREKKLHNDLCALIKRRNVIVHSPWMLDVDDGEPADKDPILSMSMNRKLKGPAWETRTLRFDELQGAIREARRLDGEVLELLRYSPEPIEVIDNSP